MGSSQVLNQLISARCSAPFSSRPGLVPGLTPAGAHHLRHLRHHRRLRYHHPPLPHRRPVHRPRRRRPAGIKAKLLGAYLLSRRGKRSAEEEQELPTLETFATLEVEDCYKRVICAASTGELKNHQVENVLALFTPVQHMQAPLSHKAMKFVEAARYGGSRRSVAKCEHRYTCSLGMDLLQDCSELWGETLVEIVQGLRFENLL